MDNQNPFYSPPDANFIKFLPHARKSGCNGVVLLVQAHFCTKSVIGKRVQVGGALQGEGLCPLDVLVVELVDPAGPAGLLAIARRRGHAGELGHKRRGEKERRGDFPSAGSGDLRPTQQPPPAMNKKAPEEQYR